MVHLGGGLYGLLKELLEDFVLMVELLGVTHMLVTDHVGKAGL